MNANIEYILKLNVFYKYYQFLMIFITTNKHKILASNYGFQANKIVKPKQ